MNSLDYGPEWAGSQQLRLAFQNLALSLTAGIFCAFIVVVLLWPSVDNRGLILWLGTISCLTLLRLSMQQTYARAESATENYRLWHTLFVTSACASGCAWGALSVFLFPESSVLHQAYLTFVIGGVCAGAVTVYAPVPGAFTAFTVPVVVPYAVRIWMMGDNEGNLMAGLVTLFLLILMKTARESRQNVRDILDLQVRNADLTRALHHRATHDSLVNLVNHGEFARRLKQLAQDNRRDNSEYSLVFVDLDLFKEVNDNGGHGAGDRILKGVGDILRSRIRAGDTAARVGGDEFAMLLDGCPRERALDIAEEIRKDIADLCVEYEGQSFSVTASVGVSYGRSGVNRASGMLKAADAACYNAKEEGRNVVCINAASDLFESTDRFELTQTGTGTSF